VTGGARQELRQLLGRTELTWAPTVNWTLRASIGHLDGAVTWKARMPGRPDISARWPMTSDALRFETV